MPFLPCGLTILRMGLPHLARGLFSSSLRAKVVFTFLKDWKNKNKESTTRGPNVACGAGNTLQPFPGTMCRPRLVVRTSLSDSGHCSPVLPAASRALSQASSQLTPNSCSRQVVLIWLNLSLEGLF